MRERVEAVFDRMGKSGRVLLCSWPEARHLKGLAEEIASIRAAAGERNETAIAFCGCARFGVQMSRVKLCWRRNFLRILGYASLRAALGTELIPATSAANR